MTVPPSRYSDPASVLGPRTREVAEGWRLPVCPASAVSAPLILSNCPSVAGTKSGEGWRDHRGVLRDQLRRVLPSYAFQGFGRSGAWSWRKLWQQAIAKEAGIVSDWKKEYREWNFARCSGGWKSGEVVAWADGKRTFEQLRCSERFCPECSDTKATEVATEYAQVFESVSAANCVERAWFCVFTLPDSVEAAFFDGRAGKPELKALRRGLMAALRHAFGLEARGQLLAYVATHPVGDRSLGRPRVHFHAGMLPVALVDNDLVSVERDRLDVEQLRREWGKILVKVFGPDLDLKPQCKVSWIPVNEPGRLRHRIRYDCRGFGADFTDGPVAWSQDAAAVVVTDRQGWQVLPVQEYAKLWIWARQWRSVMPYGPLKYRARCQDVLGIHQVVESVPDEIVREPGVALVRRKKVYNKEHGQVRWEEIVTVYVDLPQGLVLVPECDIGGRGGADWMPARPPSPLPTLT